MTHILDMMVHQTSVLETDNVAVERTKEYAELPNEASHLHANLFPYILVVCKKNVAVILPPSDPPSSPFASPGSFSDRASS